MEWRLLCDDIYSFAAGGRGEDEEMEMEEECNGERDGNAAIW